MQTSSDYSEEQQEGNPSNSSIIKVLSQSESGPQHSFQHRLDNYQSIMDDDYDDRVVAEAKSSGRQSQQRKSFVDTTHTGTQALGQFAKSSSALSEMEASAKGGQEKASSVSSPSNSSAAGFGSKEEAPGASSRFHVARPHHLPKMNALSGLSGNLEKIRMSMGEEVRRDEGEMGGGTAAGVMMAWRRVMFCMSSYLECLRECV